MPIGGFVVTIDTGIQDNVLSQFSRFPGIEIHAVDKDGNCVIVIDTQTSDEMEQITRQIQKIDGVIALGATYFHAEDEIEKIARGELEPTLTFGRKGEKPTKPC